MATDTAPVDLVRIFPAVVKVPIRGTAPLIVHRWDEKAKQMMLNAQQSKTRVKKAPKDPEADFQASRYRIDDDRDGFPSVGFKAAIINAVTLFDGLTKVAVKQSLSVIGEGPDQLVPIEADAPIMREDCVRVGMGTADLRYRASYYPWSATLEVRYIERLVTEGSVLALVDAAGHGGVGEWRPSAPKSLTGTFGTFEVAA